MSVLQSEVWLQHKLTSFHNSKAVKPQLGWQQSHLSTYPESGQSGVYICRAAIQTRTASASLLLLLELARSKVTLVCHKPGNKGSNKGSNLWISDKCAVLLQ